MPDEYFIHTIDVDRRTSTGEDSFGEEVFTVSTFYHNIIARLETSPLRTAVEYRESGQRPERRQIVYVPSTITCISEDKIYDTSSGGRIYIGLVMWANPAIGPDGGTDHYELHIEAP